MFTGSIHAGSIHPGTPGCRADVARCEEGETMAGRGKIVLGVGNRQQQRLAARVQLRRAQLCRRQHSGQTLIIFALSLTVLLGLAGLAVDATRAYDLTAPMHPPAEAAPPAGDSISPHK